MGQRYGMLPSQVLGQATTLDFKIMDITDSFIQYQKYIQDNGRPPPPKLSIDQMKALMDKVKKK
jgi:hypothetical protein